MARPILYVAMLRDVPVSLPQDAHREFVHNGDDSHAPGAENGGIFVNRQAAEAKVAVGIVVDGETTRWYPPDVKQNSDVRRVLLRGSAILGWVEPAYYERRNVQRRRRD